MKDTALEDIDTLTKMVNLNYTMQKSRIKLFGQVVFCWVCQVSLFYSILQQNRDIRFETMEIPTLSVGFSRFIAGIMMHVAMNNELNEGMAKMKFAVNHQFRFSQFRLAFLAGLLQTIMIALVTLLNYYVILVGSLSVIEIAMDFLAMKVISEFDDFFYEEYPNDEIAKQILDQYIDSHNNKADSQDYDSIALLFQIKTTSSSTAQIDPDDA